MGEKARTKTITENKVIVHCAFDKMVPIDNIKEHPKNPNKHPKEQIELLKKIIKAHGIRTCITVSSLSGFIIRGHGRFEALKGLGLKNVPVNFQDYKSNAEELADLVADNKISELSYLEDKFIKDIQNELKDMHYDMELTGMSNEDMDRYNGLDRLIDPPDKDIIHNQYKIKTGDIITLNNHRLMCGDSIKPEDIKKLMAGKIARMIHTDPPYNVDYGVSKKPKHKIRTIKNDKLGIDAWETFCKGLYGQFKAFCDGDIYMWGAPGPEGMKARLWLTEAGCHWSATIIWQKDRLVLTPANYQRKYEPCFYGWFNKSSFNKSRKETEVWEIKRPSTSKLHPTMKPIELCGRAIINSSVNEDIVLDLFGGSGSTLIAADQLKRICYMCEMDEHYCSVIIQRFIDYRDKAGLAYCIKINGKTI